MFYISLNYLHFSHSSNENLFTRFYTLYLTLYTEQIIVGGHPWSNSRRDYLSRYELFWPTENYTLRKNHVTQIFTITLVRCGLALVGLFFHQILSLEGKSVLFWLFLCFKLGSINSPFLSQSYKDLKFISL